MKLAIAALTGLMLSAPGAFADDADDYRKLLTRSQLSLMGAADLAAFTVRGNAVRAELKSDDGLPIYKVHVVAGDEIYEVLVDGALGVVKKIDD